MYDTIQKVVVPNKKSHSIFIQNRLLGQHHHPVHGIIPLNVDGWAWLSVTYARPPITSEQQQRVRRISPQFPKGKTMNTALVQTTFWKDEEIFQLNIDTKLLYLFLMTCPERNCTRFYKCPDRLISAYIGLTNDALAVCKRQIELAGLIYFKDDWLIISNDSYVQPAKGGLSAKLYIQDYTKVPGHIIDFAEQMIPGCSGAAQDYINNNINKDKDNNKDKSKNKDKDKTKDNKKQTLGALLRAES